jgi:hypothetical protein
MDAVVGCRRRQDHGHGHGHDVPGEASDQNRHTITVSKH